MEGVWKVSAALPLKCLTSRTPSFHSSVQKERRSQRFLPGWLSDVHQPGFSYFSYFVCGVLEISIKMQHDLQKKDKTVGF